MTELKPLPIEEIKAQLSDDDLEVFGIGTDETVSMAESLLALAVDSCESVKNHASVVFEGKDGRLLVITARYTDGIPLEHQYAKVVRQRDGLHEALKKAEPLALQAYDKLGDEEQKLIVAEIIAKIYGGLAYMGKDHE